ncbi:MAG: lipid A export permease/ATP-binding protein MsbA [Gammaproteobacteria bacterium]|nr:lipid A export permease/ATP-binding protein MsbA [Gammaproteobacteria bacterium]MCP5425702.1 lipid A export permease/ATP-binding protein MsbA [Gammaproteobacteria bacterium]
MNSKDLYLRLLRYVKPYRHLFVMSILGIVILAATEPVLPALVKPLLDGSFVAKDPLSIKLVPLLMVGIFLIRGVASFVGAVAMKAVANRVVMDLRNEMFGKLLSLPTQRFDDTSTGNLLSKLTYDVSQVTNASTQALVTLVQDSLSVAGLLLWIFYLNWKLALVSFLIAPVIMLVVRIISRRLRGLSRNLQQAMGDLNHVIDEVIQGHKVVKVFAGQPYEKNRFHKVSNWVRRYNMKLVIASEASVPVVQFLAACALAATIYMASLQSAANELTVGGFVSLFGAMAMLLAPIKRLTKLNEPLQRGLAAAESIFGLLDEQPEPDHGTQSAGRTQGRVSFQDVGMRYRDQNSMALRTIDLTVEPGETIALVGPSGSGKTTLMNLLPRFYEATQGRILLDGVDIRSLRLTDLRANLAYVGQDIVLFNGTVAANISYGANSRANEADIIEAAEQAYAMEFIRELPEGLRTRIGENGARLSGGQRQRIAIARALLKNAPILILDEATSALDTQSERKVQQALEHLRKGRTAFIVAHRLSTIENADRIAVLNRGEIVELGSHEELLSQEGLYASLYRMQVESVGNAADRHIAAG